MKGTITIKWEKEKQPRNGKETTIVIEGESEVVKELLDVIEDAVFVKYPFPCVKIRRYK